MSRRLICFLLFSALALRLDAATVKGLYEAEVGVDAQGEEYREEGFRQALGLVLLKVTGSEYRAKRVLESLSTLSSRYVQTFSMAENPLYESEDSVSNNELIDGALPELESEPESEPELVNENTVSEEEVLPYLLSVSFSKALLDKKLSQMNVAVWGDLRPDVGVVFVSETQGARSLLANGVDKDIDGYIEASSQGVGVPMSLITEATAARLSSQLFEVWDLQFGALDSLLLGAGADLYVIVKATEKSVERFKGQWAMKGATTNADSGFSTAQVRAPAVLGGSISVDSVAEFWNEVALGVAEYLSKTYAISANVSTNDSQEIILKVSGVSDYQAYASLGNYLSNLEVIETAQLKSFHDGVFEFALQLKGTEEQFVQYLALEQKLSASPEPNIFEPGVTPLRVWAAQWLGK